MAHQFNEHLNFEISFYEGILERNPNFVEALIALGDAYAKQGRFQEGLSVDRRLVRLKPKDPTVYYNFACSYSLLGLPKECLWALEKSLKLGYRDFSFMERDPDLEFIRKDPRYRVLLDSYCGEKPRRTE